jgi:hypothetical protein
VVVDHLGLVYIHIVSLCMYGCSEAELAVKLRGPGWIRNAEKWLDQARIVGKALSQGQGIAVQDKPWLDESLGTFLIRNSAGRGDTQVAEGAERKTQGAEARKRQSCCCRRIKRQCFNLFMTIDEF